MLKIYPKLPSQIFEEPPLEEEILSFIRELGHIGETKFLSDVNGMYLNKTIDLIYLLWEGIFVLKWKYKILKKNSDMYYPRFTKVIVDYFMAKIPKPKTTKKKADSESSPKTKSTQDSKGKRITTLAKGDKPAKKKQSASKSKGLMVLYEVALTEAQQMKIAIERIKIQTHSSHASCSGAGDKPKVPDVPDYRSESEQESWTYSQGEDDEDNDEHDSENNNDDEDDDQENDDDDAIGGEQEDEEDEELYGDLNLNLYRRDTEMTDAQNNQDTEKVYVTLTTEPPVVQQQSSSVSSDLVSKFINPSPDIGIDSILNPNVQSDILVNVSVCATTETPSFDTTIPQPPIPIIQPQQQTHDSTTTTTLPEIPNFASLFGFERRVEKYVTESLGAEVLARSSNQPQTSYAAATSLSEFELKKILIDKIEENKSMNRSDIQKNLYNTLIESYNSDKDLFASYGDVVTLKKGRDDQDKDEEPSARSNRGTKRRRPGKEESS
ncbi:hypothetical protein Tco_0013469 [Tanacetum coccineum]